MYIKKIIQYTFKKNKNHLKYLKINILYIYKFLRLVTYMNIS